MSKAADYNGEQLRGGVITADHITLLTETWQKWSDLHADGLLGPATLASLDKEIERRSKSPRCYPLVVLPDGRLPMITSGYWTENQDRDGVNGEKHMGADFGYRWLDSDPDMPVGDGGAVQVNGKRRFWYPPLDSFPLARVALAACAGRVAAVAETRTGWRCWVEHTGGLRTGYFHLASVVVNDNQVVAAGQPLGVVGHNPSAKDPIHLHFEVSPIGRYVPENPRSWLMRAQYLSAAV